jgi:anti-sigma factor RsiW
MNCSRVRKWISLYAGADLSARKARRLEKHLERCANCRKEIEELRAALAGIRAVAGRDTLDWPEGEWKDLMARLKSEKPGPRPVSPLSAIPRKAWAYGFAILLVFGVVTLILRSLLSPPAAPLLSEIITATPAQPSRSLMTDEVPSVSYPRDVPFRVRRDRTEALDRAMFAAGRTPEKTTQNLMSMTLVSQETGLKVHWTFNRNFEWKEKKR